MWNSDKVVENIIGKKKLFKDKCSKNKGIYMLINMTDGIPARQDTYDSYNEAVQGKKEFKEYLSKLQEHQGYYLTSNGYRMNANDVDVEIVEL